LPERGSRRAFNWCRWQWRRVAGPALKRRVDFVIAGTQRGGTTALDAYLRQHPEIRMADLKEVSFFDKERNFGDSAVNYDAYHRYFSPRRRTKVVGEATPNYMYDEHAARRLHEYNPQLKLILLLRNPIDRAYSGWHHHRLLARFGLSFSEALRREPELIAVNRFRYGTIERGRYVTQLERIWSFFPREQTLLLRSDDLDRHPQAVLDATCDFLGVARHNYAREIRRHVTDYAVPMSETDRRYLQKLFEPDVRELERLTGWDLGEWLGEKAHVAAGSAAG
jgi:hypothetical protein